MPVFRQPHGIWHGCGFGGVHEESGRACGGEGGGDLAADMAGFANAAYDHAAAAVQKKFNGARKAGAVELAGQLGHGLRFVQQHLAAKFNGAFGVKGVGHGSDSRKCLTCDCK